MSEKEAQLLQERRTIKAGVTRIRTYVNRHTMEDDVEQLNIRNEKIEELWSKYNLIQQQLENIDVDKHENDRDQFESHYYETKSLIEKAIKGHNIFHGSVQSRGSVNSSVNNGVNNEDHTWPQVKLPQLNLPQFSGNYKEWRNFYDMFTAVIHENRSIPDIQKLFYLKSSLKGEAHQIIEAITATADNYSIALQLLCDRYNNENYIIDAHMKGLFELPSATKDSVSGLRNLVTETKQHIRSLESLGLPTQHWDAIILFMLAQKLDVPSRREWELTKGIETRPSLDSLYRFIEQRCFALEAISSTEKRTTDKAKPKSVHVVAEQSHQKAQRCICCNKGSHFLSQCDKFLKQSVEQRIETIKITGVCFNCLWIGHPVTQCRARGCRKCGRKHNTLIHYENIAENSPSVTGQSESVPPPEQQHSSVNVLHNYEQTKQVLLSTAEVLVRDNHGEWQLGRALLDSGSQSNFVSTRFSKRLHCKQMNINVPITGISQLNTNIKRSVKLDVKSRINNFRASLDFLVLDNITNELPSSYINRSQWNIPNLPLADYKFNEPRDIDLLIGAELYFDIMMPDQIKLGKGLPILQNSQFGWIVAGKLFQARAESLSCHLSITTNQQLSQQMSKFWETEEIPHEKQFSNQEVLCEDHFQKNTTRDEEGRFVVRLPFKNDTPEFGDSYHTALKRFKCLEEKFRVNTEFKQQYVEFLKEYQELNHMEVVSDEERDGYYIPHHAVMKTTSLTTKMRVVFDASAKTSNGRSLNDELLVGPTIQDDLFSIVTRFRQHKIVLTADIEKMYRQIRVNDCDTKYQKIIWRAHSTEPIQSFKLKTVTYGTAPAPFMAIRSLHQLAIEEYTTNPIAASKLRSDFYVDDLLTGADSLEDTTLLRDQLIDILERGGFRLRKWSSNSKELLSTLENKSNDPLLLLDTTKAVKTLGLEWDANEDTIRYSVKAVSDEISITKRQILSQIARLFDPLGLVGPLVVKAKIIMQQLWQIKADWDEPVPNKISEDWMEFTDDLNCITRLSIPRRIVIDKPVEIQLHAFCDASEQAYGACIYLRSTNENNEHLTRLVCSRSKIAPLKRLSLPRLELCAAVLLVRLFVSTRRALSLNISKTYFWTDSTISLHWINTPAYLLKTFVANRVAEIQSTTEASNWRHIRSQENPGDIISRGTPPNQLLVTDLWWNGPSWINSDEANWPEGCSIMRNTPYDDSELKPVSLSAHSSLQPLDIFEKFSSLTKLQRTMAYCRRFFCNARKKPEERELKSLTVDELHQALEVLIKLAQQNTFEPEIRDLKHKQQISNKSSLKQLYPFLDARSILRVGGRLQNADVPYEQKHQIILPARHTLTKLIYRETHVHLLHAGNQAVLSNIRQKYWPLRPRAGIKHVIHNCLTCFKLKAAQQTQLMGQLPPSRVIISRPFLNTGVDYGGPIPIRLTRRTSDKAYIALFVCMATKAIHIELVSSLSTAQFLAAFRRFIARRGKCANVYSDNGTNFKGANNELIKMHEFLKQESNQADIINASSMDGTQWHFIPPGAPHFGGLWEAGIKTVKFHLKRVVGECILSFEELYTLLTQIEACVNSRPLLPLSDDPSTLSYLTPSHFLIGDTLTSIPEIDLTDTPVNRLTRWQLVQQKMQHFWKTWSNDYLNQLQQRSKWTRETSNVTIDAMVLLREENTSPLTWKLARITQLHPGRDGKVRVVTVKTTSGDFKRPVTKICLLPSEDISKPGFQGGRNVGDANRTLHNSHPAQGN